MLVPNATAAKPPRPAAMTARRESRGAGGGYQFRLVRRLGTSGRERLVLTQDRRLELPEVRAGLEAELVLEHAATRLVGVQRVRLAAGAVEREHQLGAQPLAIGVLGHERRAPGRVRCDDQARDRRRFFLERS